MDRKIDGQMDDGKIHRWTNGWMQSFVRDVTFGSYLAAYFFR